MLLLDFFLACAALLGSVTLLIFTAMVIGVAGLWLGDLYRNVLDRWRAR